MEINNTKQHVSCSFCNEELSPAAIGEHLMMCGNKTDQCPNCRRYIRRAIFAYHYENNCADLDELDGEVNAATVKKPENLSTFQPNNSPQFTSSSAAENDKKITIKAVHLATYPYSQTTATSQQSNSSRVHLMLSTFSILKVF